MEETRIQKKVNGEVKEHTEYFTEGDEFSNTKGGTKKNLNRSTDKELLNFADFGPFLEYGLH